MKAFEILVQHFQLLFGETPCLCLLLDFLEQSLCLLSEECDVISELLGFLFCNCLVLVERGDVVTHPLLVVLQVSDFGS